MNDSVEPGGGSQVPEPPGDGPLFQRILIPLDGSRLAEVALPVAAALARALDSTIVLLHVIERGARASVHGERHLTTLGDADTYLAKIAGDLAREGVRTETHTHEVPEGDVARSIAQHADEHHVDLIVLCTHGHGGMRDMIWGSIAQQTLTRGALPVLLVRAGDGAEREPTYQPFAPRSIMVPLDATAAAEAGVRPAAALARALGSELRLIVVVATSGTLPGTRLAASTLLPGAMRAVLEVEQRQAGAYLDRLAETVRATGVPVAVEVRRGDAVDQLALDQGEHADGLVVVATHGRAGLQAIWSGSVAARLLARTRAPVLLVPIVESQESSTAPAGS